VKNVLRKRLPRYLKRNLGIYGGIALFIALVICFTASYIIGNQSGRKAYDHMVEENRQEDGNFTLAVKTELSDLQEWLGSDIELSYQPYIDVAAEGETTIRFYQNRTSVNIPEVFEGNLPAAEDEIALDRLFAEEQALKVGDRFNVDGRKMMVSGIVGLPDYVISLKSTGDLLADRKVFGVGIANDTFFETFDENKMAYRYSYKYKGENRTDEVNQKNHALVKTLGDKGLLTDFCAIGDNTRVNSVVSKMEMNMNTAMYFMLLSMFIVAFLFALVSIHTFEEECAFVGVLIATGYKKRTILKHYLTIPFLVTFVSSILGLGLAMTIGYRLPGGTLYAYNVLPDLIYTLDPKIIALMLLFPSCAVVLINLIVFGRKLNLTPLKLIRRDIKKEAEAKTAREMKKVGFLNRFRLRTVVRNKGKYISLVIGVFLSGWLIMFGLGMRSSFDEYIETLPNNAIASYQYVLKAPVPDATVLPEGTEKDTISVYEIEYKERMLAVNVIGISEKTRFLRNIDVSGLKEDEIIISDIMAEKLGISEGDTIHIDNKLTLHEWKPTVKKIVNFQLGVYVFTTQSTLNGFLEKDADYYNVLFTDTEITDLDTRRISGVVTKAELADSARQMKTLMGSLIVLLTAVGIICYVIVMFMLTKMVIDKNALNISLLKVFGYRNKEVNKLYLSQTEWIIILAVITFLPLQQFLMSKMWPNLLSSMSGFFYFKVTPIVLISIVLLGTATCLITNMLHVKHVRKIDMTEALKNRE